MEGRGAGRDIFKGREGRGARMGHWMALARIMFMTGALMALLALHDTLIGGGPSGFNSAFLGSLVLICTLGYYVLAKIAQAAVGRPARAGQARRSGVYMDMQENKTAIVTGVPKLTIENVWILVYGLGAIVFVMSYTWLGVEPVSLTCMGVAMGVLCMDELVNPKREMAPVHVAIRIGAMLSGLIALCLVFIESFNYMVQRFMGSGDWPAAVGGVGLPFLSQFLMLCVRDFRKYTVGGVIEICEFGLPFAVILSSCLLWTAETERRQEGGLEASYTLLFNETVEWYRNLTLAEKGQDPVASWGAYLCVAPLLLAPSLVIYVACVLDGCAVDPLLSVSLAASVQYTIRAGPSVFNIYALLCSSAGVLLRMGSELGATQQGESLQAQEDSPQIPSRVLRQAEVRDLQAAGQETVPLNPDQANV